MGREQLERELERLANRLETMPASRIHEDVIDRVHATDRCCICSPAASWASTGDSCRRRIVPVRLPGHAADATEEDHEEEDRAEEDWAERKRP